MTDARTPPPSPAPARAEPAAGRSRGSATVWVVLVAGTAGHVLAVAQQLRTPPAYVPADWVLSGVILAVMAALGVATVLGVPRRAVMSLLVNANVAYLLARLGVSLFVVGHSDRILTELGTLLVWLLTMPMIEASMRTSVFTHRLTVALPGVLAVMTAVFALTPAGGRARPEVWFGLTQLSLACLGVVLGAQVVNAMRAALRSSRADNAALSRLAFVDPLTGLRNRPSLDEHLREHVARARPFGLLFLDLDGFKAINDTLGHATGDEVLRRVAARLNALVPPGSCVARVSGDEFVLCVPVGDAPGVSAVAGRVVEALAAAFDVDGQSLRVSVSVGGALYPLDAVDARGLLLRADRAMYDVKRSGKNGYRLYGGHLLDRDERRQVLERDLRHALARGELFVEYQPICTLPHGRPVGVEALVRWRHPEFGVVVPDVFVPIAEECGLITALGGWVLEEALGAAGRWRAAGFADVRVAVNVSPLQLMQAEFVPAVARALDRSGVPGGALELEVTEGLDLRGRVQVARSVEGVRTLGVGLSLDDFGTGYASLSRLNDLPVDVVKIDRVFVADLTGDVERPRRRYVRTLVAAMVTVAATLGLELVAEGVETPEQAQELLHLGCTRAQGYLYSPPVAEAELGATLARLAGPDPV